MTKKLYEILDGEKSIAYIAADSVKEAWEKAISMINEWDKENPSDWEDIDLHMKQNDLVEV